MAATDGAIRIGISGWRYAGWRGKFYPDGLRQKDELAYAARHFASIEINGTFYSLQAPESFARWAAPPALRRSRDVYVYFDNDAKVRAPVDAKALMRLLAVSAPCARDG